MILLTPSQAKIAKSNTRFRVVNAGRRFGKSVLASEEMKAVALSREARIVYIAPTIQQARDIMWGMLKKELLPITIKSKEAPSLELEVMNKDGKSSFILLRGWEAIETLRGQSFDLVILDEVANMRNFWVGWDEVLSPTLIDRKGSAMFISTPKGFNHFYDLYNKQTGIGWDKPDPNYESFHFTTYDNPNIPPDEIEREKLSKPEDTFAQEYLADFRKQEGLVYKEFSRDIHIYKDEQPSNAIKTIAGVDFGFTNPTAVITIVKDFDNSYWITNEWYKRGKTDQEIAKFVSAHNFNEVYPDPESPSAIAEMEKLGVNCQEVVKNKDSVQNGINRIRMLLQQRKLKVHESCINLISEFETYRYEEDRPDKNAPEKPIKENDHALDALRYAITMDEPVNIRAEIRMSESIYRNRESRKNGFE